MNKVRNQVQTISYGDVVAQAVMWQKAVMLMPLWAVLVIPIIGFVFRSLGPVAMQIGYGLVLACCANYFFEDLLKRKIRLDDENIFFGFRVIPIRDISGIEVVYKKRGILPAALLLRRSAGKSLKLSLNGLTNESVERLLRHLQSRNSGLKTAPVLNTLVKCRRVTQRSVSDTAELLILPYHGKQLLDESLDEYRVAARQWMRMGPLAVCILAGPLWMTWLSGLYLCLTPNAVQHMQAINLHAFLEQFFEGIQGNIFVDAKAASSSLKDFASHPVVLALTTTAIVGFFFYLYRLFLKPNSLVADTKGINLDLRFGELSLPLGRISLPDITQASLFKPPKHAGIDAWKIRLIQANGKKFDMALSALALEDRARLLRRIEKFAPQCQIDTELSYSMLPRAEHSYTELWLQSLTQAPQRKTMEPLEPGQLIGEERFQVLKRLGVGGQGTAYLCKSLQSDNDPADSIVLKETILPVFVENSVRRNALEKFEQEARLLQSLDSDRIVKLLGYFIEDHRSYLVLEHIDGLPLRELVLRDGPLDQEQARDIALQMCEILRILHSHSIVHRDFTPDNLILNSAGKLKLIDFNVAQQLKAGTTGTIVGKHAYLPPEQFRGKVNSQSDLYAMGATLYFLLTGTDPEPISQSSPMARNAEIAADLDQVVRHATALQCDKRYQSADEIEKDLLGSEVSSSPMLIASGALKGKQLEVSENG